MRDDFFHQKRGLDLLDIRQQRELRVVGFLIGGQIRSGDQKDVVLFAEDPMRFDDAWEFFQGFFKFCDFSPAACDKVMNTSAWKPMPTSLGLTTA